MTDDYINHETFQTMDFSAYPPCLVAWPIFIVDTICDHYLGGICSEWRSVLPENLISEDSTSWFSVRHKMKKTPNEYLPELLSYQDFLNNTGFDSGEAPYSIASMKRFAFATSSTSLASVLSWTSLFVLAIIVSFIRLIKAKTIPTFSNMARNYCRKTHGSNYNELSSLENMSFGCVFIPPYHSLGYSYFVISHGGRQYQTFLLVVVTTPTASSP